MARPIKHTVDYFPHDTDASTGKTLYIIESQYGNNGYSFWFKLLELLGRTEGHVYDCNNKSQWEYLLAITHITDEIGNGILSTLGQLGAIDLELWEHHIIWSQNLVNRLSDVYSRRKIHIPIRPSLDGSKNTLTEEENEIEKQKVWCRNATNKAIQKGVLTRQPCTICQEVEGEAHHTDYTDPLTVIWLCPLHHKCIHNGELSVVNGDNNSNQESTTAVNGDNNSNQESTTAVIVDNNHQSKLNKSKLNKSKLNIPIIPEWINKDTWNDFLEMRKKKRSIPTARAKELLIKELEKLKLAGDDPNEILNQSIMRNYTGVFPLNKIGNKNGKDKWHTSGKLDKPSKFGHMVKQ